MKMAKVISIALITGIMLALTVSLYFYTKARSYPASFQEGDKELGHQYHFSFIVQEYENPYLLDLFSGAEKAANDYHISLDYKGPRQTNFEEQIKLIEKAIASKVDGIITQGLSEEFIPIIQKAIDANIPVITIDTDLEGSARQTYIGTNNYQAGVEVGKLVMEENKPGVKVGVIAGDLHTNQHTERVRGFVDAIKSEDKIEVVGVEMSNLSNIQATEKTYQMLRDHPDIEVFFGTSAMDGFGIANGIEIYRPNQQIKVYAFDDISENIELLKEGKIHAIIQQLPYEMGYKSIERMLQLKTGDEIESYYYTDVNILKNDASIPTE